MIAARSMLLLAVCASVVRAGAADRWLTDYERSGCTRTPRYEATIAYCRMLDRASPWVRYMPFGTSAQGRDLPCVVVSADGAFTPRAAARAGKPVILVQSGIHAGEIDGKDASLMLIRDIAIRRTLRHLLDHATLLFVPIFNVDGHERFGPYNRINQNGPEEMGWRTTAQNLNLNRDYMKADAPEMRAMLRLIRAWQPDLFIDCHVTDGIDMQYDVTYSVERGPHIDSAVTRWTLKALLPRVLPAVEAAGHKVFTYVWPREENDPARGLQAGASLPRLSTGYFALHNRPAVLIETHMLKPYRVRVEATMLFVRAAIEAVDQTASDLRGCVRGADERTARRGKARDRLHTEPLRLGVGKRFTTMEFLGIAARTERGVVSGMPEPVYTGQPVRLSVPFYDEITVLDSTVVPLAYLVPPEWSVADTLLQLHGLRVRRLRAPATLPVESYRFPLVSLAPRPYEGRQMASVATETIHEERTFPRGTLVVPMDQPAAHLALHLLEPRAEDSFVSWGFMNAIFEQKEYAEAYVMERIAGRLFAAHPELKQEFDAKLRADSAFAHSPGARVTWLFQHSPWADRALNLYPVGRVMDRKVMEVVERAAGVR